MNLNHHPKPARQHCIDTYWVSCVVATGAWGVVLYKGLFVAVMATALSYLLTRALLGRFEIKSLTKKTTQGLAVAAVTLLPVLVLILMFLGSKAALPQLKGSYSTLSGQLDQAAQMLHDALPGWISSQLPSNAAAFHDELKALVKHQAGALSRLGQDGLHIAITGFVGWVVGILIALDESSTVFTSSSAVYRDLRSRAKTFVRAFEQIMLAQVIVAAINAGLTAFFLFVVVPIWFGPAPYASALVVATFLFCLIPIVGNLMCNALITAVGLSVSVHFALTCLVFLVAIHKLEYFINSKVIGSKTKTATWELLVVLVVSQALLGVVGLIAGPLLYTQLKLEVRD